MLPLWIIDITEKSDRRDAFKRLVGEIDHVYPPTQKTDSDASSENVTEQSDNVTDEPLNQDVNSKNDNKKSFAIQVPTPAITEKSAGEEDEEAEKEEAARNEIIKGNYWYYSSYEFDDFFKEDFPEFIDERIHEEMQQEHDYSKLQTKLQELQEEIIAMRVKLEKKERIHEKLNADLDEDINEKERLNMQAELQEEIVKKRENLEKMELRQENLKAALEKVPEKYHKIEYADKLYDFQEALIEDAVKFIDQLRCSNIKPYQTINIAVLGDATEKMTQLVFASIAVILQKEKGRFLQGHIHQGISVMGMLYVPCDINTRKVDDRVKVLRMFREIDVQHRLPNVRGYDYMMLYQNVQNRTECTYTKLNDKELAEYLLQCLVHLFLACDVNHPLIHGTGSDDTFYFSMGAASIYFDMSYEDEKDANRVAHEIINTLKKNGDDVEVNYGLQLLDKGLYRAAGLISHFNDSYIDLEEKETHLNPHPIHNFFHRNLKRFYYDHHLRFYPAELLRDILRKTEEETSEQLNSVSSYCTNAFNNAEITLLPNITRVLSKINQHTGGLVFIENQLKGMQKVLSKEKDNIRASMENSYWFKIMKSENPHVPEDMLGHFEEYHDTYTADIQTQNSGAGCDSMKKDVLDKLKVLLSKEKTFMGTVTRTFFMGVVCVLGILPILDFISPTFIDLGNIRDHAFAWGTVVFLMPFVWQLISYYLYLRKRNSYIKKLKAYYMHDAHARVANRIEFEAREYYDKLIALLEEYLKRCDMIRNDKDLNDISSITEFKMLIPKSMFNQPLNGGNFGGEELIPEKDIECSRIKVNHEPRYINELTISQYFLLTNYFNDEISILFKDVKLIDSHKREYDENKGEDVFVSMDEQKQELAKKWEENKQRFKNDFLKGIHEQMVPRENPTVGEKVIQYKKNIGKPTILNPLMAYAATNGEIVSQSDTEYADVKVNQNIEELTKELPLYTTRHQTSKHYEIYKKYIFVTRWRSFEHLSFNRILPKEDFDEVTRSERIFTAEQMRKERESNKIGKRPGEAFETEKRPGDAVETEKKEKPYKANTSSLILWAVCPDDNSSEWLKLFAADHFTKAYEDREIIREILNKND